MLLKSAFPLDTLTKGVSINPYLLTFPYVANDPISPILGPSGVSIGHILP